MPDRTKPEILRIQLSQVVLKLLEFGVPNVLTFDFVEHPDCDALEAAVETLRFVGAIRDNALTDVGKKMAALPIAPQLAKVLLDGVNLGLGTEALTSVALSSLSGQVFFRGGTEEIKEKSDKKKLIFCHPMDDQMTSLSVYQCWQIQKKEDRTKWCLENCVNAKSMRIVEETIKELSHILRQNLKVYVPLKLQSLEAADCYLGKLYFDAFLTNLAIYLGHEQAGYMTSNKSSGSFVIFPGSSLRQLSSTPQYVIYEKTLKTSQQFLTQVMHVNQEWVDEAVRMGKLPEDPTKTFSDLMLTPFEIAVGPQIYGDISRGRKELLDMLVINISSSAIRPVVDLTITTKQWGIVRVFAQRKYHDAVKFFVTQEVRDKQTVFQNETKEFGLTGENDLTRLVIGTGGTVQQVIMPFQFRTVIAVCSKDLSVDLLEGILRRYGEVKEMKVMKHPKQLRVSVTYSSHSAAQQALTEFNDPNITLLPKNCQQFVLKLQWERRQRGAFAFLSFDSHENCEDAYGYLCYTICKTNKIKVSHEKSNQNQLFLSGVELCTCDEDDFRARINHCLSRNITFRLKMGYVKFTAVQKVTSSTEMCESNTEYNRDDGESKQSTPEKYTEKKITDLVAKYSKPGTYSVKYEIPNEKAIFYKAYVTFYDPNEGSKVLSSEFSHEHINGKLLTVTRHLTSAFVFQRDIYIIVKDSLVKTQKNLLQIYDKRLSIILEDYKDRSVVRIKISADDVKIFSIAQKMLRQASRPLVLYCNTTELQEYIIGYPHCDDFQTIQTKSSTCLCRDLSTMSIKIYGSKENQQSAMVMLEIKAKELFSGGAAVTKESLRDRERPGLIKYLVTKYGYDLSGMLELEGVRKISLNPRLQVISLLATAKGRESVRACIEELSKLSQVCARKQDAEYEVDCSACDTPVEEPSNLVRLECCGHAYHTECIGMQLKSGTITFPVECAKDGCSSEFLWRDFENLQKRLEFRIKTDLVSASLQNFMERNGGKYKNCPTPDCKMIYATTEESREFVCGVCSVSTCTRCHEQYHAGINCVDINDDKLDEWMKEDPANRKKCPKCSCPIEKNEGCMHMSCNCGAHICWTCLKSFGMNAMAI